MPRGKEEKVMEIKKVIAAVLSAAMLVGTGVASLAAAERNGVSVTLNSADADAIEGQIQIVSNGGERIKSGYTLSVSDLNNSGVCAAKSAITFYVSSDNANWTAADNTGDTYTITNDMANKQICAVLTDNSNVKYISNTVTVGENLKHVISWNKSAPNAVEKSSDANKVVFVDGDGNKSKELLMLERGSGKTMFAMSYVGGQMIYENNNADDVYDDIFDSAGNPVKKRHQIISTTDEKSIFYKINRTDFITDKIMPTSMQSYLQNTNWETEAGCSDMEASYSNMQNDTVINAKIAPISVNEYNKYASIIGYNDNTGRGIVLRTPVNSTQHTNIGKFENILTGGTLNYQDSYSTWRAIVPVFWVSNDIFKNVKAESAGAAVVAKILETGNSGGLYTDDEWGNFDFGGITGREDVKLNITSNGGDRIKSGYTLTAANKDDTEDITGAAKTIAYFISDDNENWIMAGTVEDGARFTLLNSHANKYVIAAAKMQDGTKYISNSLLTGENLSYLGEWNLPPTGMKEHADRSDRLYLDVDGFRGIGYTMLDSDDTGILLLSDSVEDKTPIYLDSSDRTKLYQIYDSNDENSIAHHINTDEFIKQYIVPDGYERYINRTYWETEAGYTDKMTNDTVDYSKIAVPSVTELYKYADKIGSRDGNSIRTRTPLNKESTIGNFKYLHPTSGIQYLKSNSVYYPLRVEARINKSMYKYVKIDAINTGSGVLAAVGFPELLTLDQAKALGYSGRELIKLGYFKDKNLIYTSLNGISFDGTNATIDIAASNPKDESTDAKIICAVYDSDNRLKLIKEDNITVASGESDTKKTIALSGVEETDKITFYFWNNGQNLYPVTDSYSYVVPGEISEYSLLDANVAENNVRICGRGEVVDYKADEDAAAVKTRTFNWTNSGFEFEFTGIVASVYVDKSSYDDSVTNGNYFNVVSRCEPNGEVSVNRIKLKQGWNEIFKADKKGTYTIALKRSSEASRGTIGISKIRTDGEPRATLAKAKKIEFIGDSFTTGYANSPELSYSKSFCAQNSDNYNSYTGFVAREFDADYNVTAYEGKGVYVNSDGSTDYTMTDLFDCADVYVGNTDLNMSTRTKWDYDKFVPQLVTVFLGENDMYGSKKVENVETGFAQKYAVLLDKIRTAYPNAKVLCIAREKGGYPESVRQAVTDRGGENNGFYYLEIKNFSASSMGHPTVDEDRKIANRIIEKINTMDGLWN